MTSWSQVKGFRDGVTYTSRSTRNVSWMFLNGSAEFGSVGSKAFSMGDQQIFCFVDQTKNRLVFLLAASGAQNSDIWEWLVRLRNRLAMKHGKKINRLRLSFYQIFVFTDFLFYSWGVCSRVYKTGCRVYNATAVCGVVHTTAKLPYAWPHLNGYDSKWW